MLCNYDKLVLRHHIGDEGEAMATIGQLSEFQPETEKASAYLERVKLFLLANSVGDDKQVAVLLTVIGARHFSLLKDLFLLEDVKAKSFEQISKVLVEHF